jgi:hypothetical protein
LSQWLKPLITFLHFWQNILGCPVPDHFEIETDGSFHTAETEIRPVDAFSHYNKSGPNVYA